jgi:Flp pilus assembly protein TadB
MQQLPVLIGLLVALLASVIMYQLTLGVRFARSKRETQLDTLQGAAVERIRPADNSHRTIVTLQDKLRSAGMNWGQSGPALFGLLRIASAAVCAMVVFMIGLPPLVAIGVGLGGYFMPQLWLDGETIRRAERIEKELPDALGDLVAILRVESSMRNALEQVRHLLAQADPKSPLANELQWTLEDFQTDEVGAFRDLANRAISPALKMLAFSLMIFIQSGGDYLAALEAQARGVRETLRARQSAAAEAAEAMLTVKLIPGVLLLVLMMFLQDPFFRSFYYTFWGQALLVIVGVLMMAGYLYVQDAVKGVA